MKKQDLLEGLDAIQNMSQNYDEDASNQIEALTELISNAPKSVRTAYHTQMNLLGIAYGDDLFNEAVDKITELDADDYKNFESITACGRTLARFTNSAYLLDYYLNRDFEVIDVDTANRLINFATSIINEKVSA